MPQSTPARVLLLGAEVASVVTGVLTGRSQPINVSAAQFVAVYLRSIGTTSGGTVLIEEADYSDTEQPFSGTWVQVASVAANTFTGGALSVTRLTGALGFVRVRISADITGGGTVTAALRFW